MRRVNLFFYYFRAPYCQELSPTLQLRITELFSCNVFKSVTVRMFPHFESFFSFVISEPIRNCHNFSPPCYWGSLRRVTLFSSIVFEPITVRMLPHLVMNCEEDFSLLVSFQSLLLSELFPPCYC